MLAYRQQSAKEHFRVSSKMIAIWAFDFVSATMPFDFTVIILRRWEKPWRRIAGFET
jgi:hypothetical protein